MTRSLKLLFIVLIGIFYFSATYYGNLKTPDSLFYIDSAKSFFYDAALSGIESQPLIYWPPLYPVILSIGVPWIHYYIKYLHFICLLSVLFIWQKIAQENDINIFQALFPEISFKRNFMLNFHELGLNFFPKLLDLPIQVVLGIVLIVVPGILFVKNYSINNIMAFFYIVFVVYFFSMSIIPTNVDDISRFMSVTLPIVYLLFFYYLLDQFMKSKPQYDKYTYVAFGIWVLYPLARMINNEVIWYEAAG